MEKFSSEDKMKKYYFLWFAVVIVFINNIYTQPDNLKNISTRSADGLLLQAAVTGNVTEFKKALNLGADINCKNSDGITVLCLVAKCRLDLVKLLVERGADVNLAGDDKITPLHWAVEYDNYEIVEYLLKAGAKTDLTDNLQETAVHWAAWTGHFKSAKMLLLHGGDPNRKNIGGFTPIDLARLQEHKTILELFEDKNLKSDK